MRRLIAAWVLAVLAGGCGTEEKKPSSGTPPPAKASEMFDKQELPRGGKKGVGPG